MSKHRAYDPSLRARLVLALSGNWMVLTGRIAAKAQASYREAYLRRYGRPSIHQQLDNPKKENQDLRV